MRATKVIYVDKEKNKYELLLPIIFSTTPDTNRTRIAFDGNTALFSNIVINGDEIEASGVTVNNNTLEEGV